MVRNIVFRGTLAALTFPPAPFRFHAAGEEGGMSGAGAILRLSTLPRPHPAHPSPAARERGWG